MYFMIHIKIALDGSMLDSQCVYDPERALNEIGVNEGD